MKRKICPNCRTKRPEMKIKICPNCRTKEALTEEKLRH
jgi:RNA polymerase subunit RPABC4/transcription elongation factor Spt4